MYLITYVYVAMLLGGIYGLSVLEKGQKKASVEGKQYVSITSFEYFFLLDESSRKAFFPFLFSVTLMFVAVYSFLELYKDYRWDQWLQDEKMVVEAYSEKIFPNALLRTKSNSLSNLFYVVVGLFSLCVGYQDQLLINSSQCKPESLGYVVRTPALSYLFGLTTIHLGLSSFFFHASLTLFGRQLDVAAMYAPLMVFISMSIGRVYPRFCNLPSWPVLTLLTVMGEVVFFIYKWQMDSAIVLPLLILLSFGSVVADRLYFPQRALVLRWLVLAVIILLVGVTCRELDVAKLFSSPVAIVQGHSVWHLLTSLSLYWTYAHHRSEPS